MSKSPLEVLEYSDKTAKRAQWEAFEFTLLEDGDVTVVNGSYDKPEEHSYTIHCEGNIPTDCTCPAWEYQEGACKHMLAVAIRKPVLNAVTAKPTRADGGAVVEDRETIDSEDEECECDDLGGFPCWPCVRDGRRELPEGN